MAFSTRVALPRIRPSLDLGEMVVIKPADEQLQAKEIPAEQFLSKAMSIRDNLRVLEQKFNSSSALSPLRLMSLQASLPVHRLRCSIAFAEWAINQQRRRERPRPQFSQR